MSLVAAVAASIGDLDLAVDVDVADGELVAVLGPNGAGKSTLLRLLAGLSAVDSGAIALDGEVLDDPTADVFVPAERRAVSLMFQDYALFPHLTVLENVAFGLRARGMRAPEARRQAREWLERMQLDDRADDRPAQLSGGQAQRVALGRALAPGPRLLLLDEPLAALDVGTRGEVRRDLRQYLAGFAGMRLMVTHDPVDAYALADRIIVLEDGAVTQAGSLADVTARPRSRYVAQLVGLNLVAGDHRAHALTTDSGATVVTASDAPTGPAFVAVRPQAVSLHREHPHGSARNVWELTVDDLDQHADRTRVRLTGLIALVAEVTPAAVTDLALRPGDHVWASVKATEVDVYPR